MSNFDDTNSLAGKILGTFGGGVDESKRLVEFEDLDDEMPGEGPEMVEPEDELPPPEEADEMAGDMQADGHFEDAENLEQDMMSCDMEAETSMLDRMADLAADAETLSADLAGIADQIGGGGATDSPLPDLTDAESEEIDVAMIDDIQARIDSIAASMEALRHRESEEMPGLE